MAARIVPVLCLLLVACADETTSAPDTGVPPPSADSATAGSSADTAASLDAPADAPFETAPPDALDAGADGPAPGSVCTGPRPGGCAPGTEWGCCGDNANIEKICNNGTWVCPAGSADSSRCCGVVNNGICRPFSLLPQCNFLFPDGGLGDRGP
jgi:hypothetical protein